MFQLETHLCICIHSLRPREDIYYHCVGCNPPKCVPASILCISFHGTNKDVKTYCSRFACALKIRREREFETRRWRLFHSNLTQNGHLISPNNIIPLKYMYSYCSSFLFRNGISVSRRSIGYSTDVPLSLFVTW